MSFTDQDGYRFQTILTDQTDPDIGVLERRHRQRARVEDRIRDDKNTGLAKLPFKAFALNEVWLEIVMLAHDLIVWTQALCLDGELAKSEPKRLRYRLLHVAARLARRPIPSARLRPPGLNGYIFWVDRYGDSGTGQCWTLTMVAAVPPNCSSTTRPVVFSHSLTRGIPERVRAGGMLPKHEGPVNAASTSGSNSSMASR